ncbi:glutamate--cysteine ligase [Corynebacterium macginleyi]|uniref:Putative glutamate--cysteine ligase 2 n=1 Tax=Corynebacterium macginleyi TaxID=38290 RepID=A0A3M0GCW7_9CORY|nr:glutamate--cysteine ligase [Corynebacterium macginleyi]MBK4149902.1 glutamate--cysteine ligase [Corynebacterium macginleyi]MBK4152311.1 glutamate--cysteine ligase [Corynebacterium macginleyi]MBK4157550.1 glutamate--cysteine ligase [Corynebacterium macginleyi]MBK4164288.1 glutamate--cysteine ligase [Corynebacterium macginleyi]MBK4168755.1 glutamate--cysteine ligase [Corynebacterium macginleyi]
MKIPAEVFARSPEPTLGVEWEVALVDRDSRDLVPRGAELIDLATAAHPDIHVEKEFLQNTVELVTGICTTVPEAIAELETSLAAVEEAAAKLGIDVWASGGHPFTDFRENPLSDKPSYQEIISRTQYWGKQMLLWGTHVHVGISHEERVWPIINALMAKYPHLLAISACSPGWQGIDTGYASNRTMLYQQLPTAGMPYQFATWGQWQSYIRDQAISGVINHTGSMHFDIRPAAKWGTVEVRVSDAASNLRELSAVVALTHCLVVHYDRMIDAGEELPVLQPWHVAENKWRGSRYGMDALVITSRETDEAWVKDELAQMVEELTPLARELGCAKELAVVHEIIDSGAGYERQRRLFQETGSWRDVVEQTCRELHTFRPVR